jgi:carboxypeptidase family protein
MRRIALGILLWLVATRWASAEIRFLDDRGEPVASPLEACFQTDLRTECVNSNSGAPIEPPGRFLLLRIEGPDHGPVSLRYEDLEEGRFARVPRKALLQIEKLPADPLTVSVYDKRAPSFDKALFSANAVGQNGIKIPAGDFLVSLSSGRQAPDLHLLSAAPGSVCHVEYRPRRGWSLVLRCRGARDRKPLAASSVSLESVLGYDAPNRLIEEQKTGEDGLAIFSGLLGRTVDAGVRHSEYLSQKVQGLSAAPGALAFREVVLEEGGRLQMKVLMEGRAQEGVGCRIVDPQAARDSQPLYEGTTNREGICRSQKLAAGSYLLFASLPEERGRLSRTLVIKNGSDTEEEFAFSKIRLNGKVSRGNDPVPGFMIRVLEVNEELNARVGVAKGQSREDGTYEIALWKPGRYGVVLLESPESRVYLIQKSIVVEAGEEQKTVDFLLESASVRGKVVDDAGKPLAEAEVRLRWGGSGERWGLTNEQGEFEFLLEDKGSGDVKAEKEGYRPSQFQEVALEDETELPPVTLVLEKEKLFKGTLSSAAGLPVAGGWVAAMKSQFGDEYIYPPREGRTDDQGRFEAAPISGVRNRLFASGPGCPLSFFEPLDSGGDLALRCQGQPAVLDLTLTDSEGRPVPNAEVVLRQGTVILPRALLNRHLSFLGLRAQTDASGRMVIPNLAPGDYDVFLASQSQIEGMIEAGSRTGYLQSVRLIPLNITELRLTVGTSPSPQPGSGL